MPLTATEAAVVARLRSLTVATMATLRQLDLSAVTVARALRKHGYFSSFNHNSAFYVLADVPRFDRHGLWWHRDVGFSRYRTLQATLAALIASSPAGCTVAELQTRLATPVGNLLSRLCSSGRVGRMTQGRCAVYLAADGRQSQQRACRERLAVAVPAAAPPRLPPAMPAATLLEVLVLLLRDPGASDASLSRTLQARGLCVSAEQIREVFDFYGLKKKQGPWPWPSSSHS